MNFLAKNEPRLRIAGIAISAFAASAFLQLLIAMGWGEQGMKVLAHATSAVAIVIYCAHAVALREAKHRAEVRRAPWMR